MPSTKLTPAVWEMLRCPVCGSRLSAADGSIACLGAACGARFPIVDGIPILIDETTSAFRLDSYVSKPEASAGSGGGVRQALWKLIPNPSKNLSARRNFARMAGRLRARSSAARILVVGGATLGYGMEVLAQDPALELVETDVTFGARTRLICDAHRLPFPDESFDGAVAQAVLEHVADPYRCVDEIHRVLKPEGLVYAETPFMFQGHLGAFDFTRFTHLGHRRLFRKFDEIDSGVAGGPGMALAWSYMAFLRSFSGSRAWRSLAMAFAWLTGFWLKYFDSYLARQPGALDAASGCYFLGLKGTSVLSDRELIGLYRGAEQRSSL